MTRASIVLLAGLLLSTACATGRVYRNDDLTLVTSYTAKETCSCLFVLEQPEEFCRTWTRYDPPVVAWTADQATKTVTATTLWVHARARRVSERDGCVLQ
jgi:hypothetical protein